MLVQMLVDRAKLKKKRMASLVNIQHNKVESKIQLAMAQQLHIGRYLPQLWIKQTTNRSGRT